MLQGISLQTPKKRERDISVIEFLSILMFLVKEDLVVSRVAKPEVPAQEELKLEVEKDTPLTSKATAGTARSGAIKQWIAGASRSNSSNNSIIGRRPLPRDIRLKAPSRPKEKGKAFPEMAQVALEAKPDAKAKAKVRASS